MRTWETEQSTQASAEKVIDGAHVCAVGPGPIRAPASAVFT